MDKNTFLMNHGPAAPGRTVLTRKLEIGKRWHKIIWVDASGEIKFDDENGHPVDRFGLRIFGDFGERS